MTTYAFESAYGMTMTTERREPCGFGTRTRYYVPGIVRKFDTRDEALDWVENAPGMGRTQGGSRELVTLDDLSRMGWSRAMITESCQESDA